MLYSDFILLELCLIYMYDRKQEMVDKIAKPLSILPNNVNMGFFFEENPISAWRRRQLLELCNYIYLNYLSIPSDEHY